MPAIQHSEPVSARRLWLAREALAYAANSLRHITIRLRVVTLFKRRGVKMTFLAQLRLSRKFYTSYIAFTAIISATVWLIFVLAEQRSRLVREHVTS